VKRNARLAELGTCLALLAIFTALVIGEASHQSATVDEFHLVPQALALRETGDLELGYKTPPLLKRWIALALPAARLDPADMLVEGRPAAEGWSPWIFGTRFMLRNAAEYERIFFRARIAMLPLAWMLGLAIYFWARAVGGRAAGLCALGIFAFSPEMIAFSSLVSLDLAVTALATGALSLLRGALRGRRAGLFLAACALFGLGLATKLSLLTLAPLFLLPLLLARGGRERARQAAFLALGAGVALLLLDASYGFDRPLPRLRDLEPRSRTFRTIRAWAPDGLRLPAPLLWLRALDGQAADVQAADVPSYLNGEWSDRGFRRYYLMAWLYKTPLALLALVAFSAALALLDRGRARAPAPPPDALPGWLDALLIGGPILLWGASFSLAGGLNIGIRYVLPCYACGAVALGVALARVPPRRLAAACAGGLFLAYAASSLAAFPHHLAYFNRIAGGERGAYRHLVDSNLDWGQELKHLSRYLRERKIERVGLGYFGHVAPELYGIDYFLPGPEPAPGWYAVSANFIAGYPYLVYDHGQLRPVGPERFRAFSRLEPVDTLAGAILIYRVP